MYVHKQMFQMALLLFKATPVQNYFDTESNFFSGGRGGGG